jgi:hypothetical protein
MFSQLAAEAAAELPVDLAVAAELLYRERQYQLLPIQIYKYEWVQVAWLRFLVDWLLLQVIHQRSHLHQGLYLALSVVRQETQIQQQQE